MLNKKFSNPSVLVVFVVILYPQLFWVASWISSKLCCKLGMQSTIPRYARVCIINFSSVLTVNWC